MTLLLLSWLSRLIFEAQIWLIMHGQIWLGLHLPRIIRWVFGFGPVMLLALENVREIIWIWAVPKRAQQSAGRGESERAITLMRRSVRAFTPLLGTRPLHLKRLYSLGQMLENARRTGEANEVWEEILKRPKLATLFESDVRKRLADGLETIGDTAAATRQRALIEDRLQKGEAEEGSDNWGILLQRGRDAAEANRYSEAVALFERALDAPKIGVLHSKRGPVDVEIATRLALAAYSAGDAIRSESAARFVIEGANTPAARSLGFRTLSLALGTQNRFQEALEASESTLREIQKIGDPNQIADARASYAMLLMHCGQVRLALTECEAASEMGTQGSRTALHFASNCALLLDDYEGAREWLIKARRAAPLVSPAAERRMQGLFDFENANVEVAATQEGKQDRAQLAWDWLQRAKPNLEGFERLLYWASASEMLVLTLLGQCDAARARLAEIEAQLTQYKDDSATQVAIWSWLARTHMELGEWELAENWWRAYFDSGKGKPVYRPRSLCQMGKCLRAQGDENGARACWQEAVDMGFDIADTRRARELLELK